MAEEVSQLEEESPVLARSEQVVQAVQDGMPGYAAKVPFVQFRQACETMSSLNWPAGHAAQFTAPTSVTVPLTKVVSLPVTQSRHWMTPAESLLYRPATHVLHSRPCRETQARVSTRLAHRVWQSRALRSCNRVLATRDEQRVFLSKGVFRGWFHNARRETNNSMCPLHRKRGWRWVD